MVTRVYTTLISLCNKIKIMLHEFMAIQCADRALRALIAGITSSAGRCLCQ
jgi:hypothetical protein